MTIRNLQYLFKPESVAFVGASKETSSVGAVVAQNLYRGGFDKPVMMVNPRHRFIQGIWTYPDIQSLPAIPELAVIATPPETVPGIISELGNRGTRVAIVMTAGFSEMPGQHGKELQQAMLDAAKPNLLRIIGPNCLGSLLPGIGLNASFAHIHPRPGRLAFLAQSGAMVTSMLDWAQTRNIGFSCLVSLGDMVDVDFADMLDYLANDRDTRAILLYIEAITNARKFMSAARAASRMKPVIVVKAGRSAEGARAATSHTGALAGRDAVYDTAFRRAGMLRVATLSELFDAAETLAMGFKPTGDRLAILTNGGGIGVLATDAVIDEGALLAKLSEKTITQLDEVLPATWSHGNPVDIIGDAPDTRYADALAVLTRDPEVDAILTLNCPTAVASSTNAAKAVIDSANNNPDLPFLTSWVGDGAAKQARQLFASHMIPSYDTPEQAVRAFMYRVNYRRNQQTLIETPPSIPENFPVDLPKAQKVVQKALAEDRRWLTEFETKEILSSYDIPVATTWFASSADEAAALSAKIDGAVVLKIVSPDIVHKTDVGGVALDLPGPEAVTEAARLMQESILKVQPEAQLSGFTVQPMIHRPGAYELIIGVTEDPQFGPTILFGQGGTAVEIVEDQALALPPLNMRLAHEVMSHTRIYKLLKGYRGLAAANFDAIAMTLIKVAQLVIDLPELKELDINPLLADEQGVIVLDGRIKIARVEGSATDRLAIRPYPKELEEDIVLGDGHTLLLRPIVPEDEPSLKAIFGKLTPEDVLLRFFIPMKTLSHIAAVRFTQLDYSREMGFILTEKGIPGKTEMFGVANIVADPDNERAEFAIIIRHDLTAMGLGVYIMKRIIDYAAQRGIKELFGDVLRHNQSMLRLCKVLGFTQSSVENEPELVRISLALN